MLSMCRPDVRRVPRIHIRLKRIRDSVLRVQVGKRHMDKRDKRRVKPRQIGGTERRVHQTMGLMSRIIETKPHIVTTILMMAREITIRVVDLRRLFSNRRHPLLRLHLHPRAIVTTDQHGTTHSVVDTMITAKNPRLVLPKLLLTDNFIV